MRGSTNNRILTAYVPTVLLTHLGEAPDELVRSLGATMMFADVSGFTRLSERLARVGREGAERLTDVINACFTALLAEAYQNGASLIKFGGDAMLIWFDGDEHAARACTAAVAMRKTLRDIVRDGRGPEGVVLRMSVGVHSGSYDTFLVGDSHREFVLAGPAASTVVAMEAVAEASQILVSEATAEQLPAACLGAPHGPGVLLARSPFSAARPRSGLPQADPKLVASLLSTELRAHLLTGSTVPEHRATTVAFIQYGELDELIANEGTQPAALALDELITTVQEAADRYAVCFLGTDVAAGGGKVILSAGAPRLVGDDDERMMLTLRQIVEADLRLPVRVGVNRGHVFAGEIGPTYRRTYTVMGDAVNLAARLMAKAPWGSIYATPGVLERSQTRFDTLVVPPFMVKGKSKPVQALQVGAAQRAGEAGTTNKRLPLYGRDRELTAIRQAIANAQEGIGGLVELVGETGSGKSRLLAEARDLAPDMLFVHATCEPYTQDIPYAGWRDPLRQGLGLSWEDDDETVVTTLRTVLEASQPDLLPWLPLLAIAMGAEAPTTREVQELAPEFRASKLHETVLRFLASALTIPTLVAMEHTHLMDEASAALLRAVAEQLEGTAWLVLTTRRDVEAGFVTGERHGTRLELGPLTHDDALALAEGTPEAHLLPPHVIELAVERSGGSPEFLLDLLAAAAGGSPTLPDSVEAAAGARIDALDPGDRTIVRRGAVLGLMFHAGRLHDVLEPGTELDEEQWERLSGVFARDPDGLVRFKRPAVCEVAYESLPFRLRRELHSKVGEALERDTGRDVDADPAVLSQHFSLAGDQPRTWKYAMIGASRASARFSQAEASRLYRRAIEAGRASGATSAELSAAWEQLGLALVHTGEQAAADQAFTSARHLSREDPIAQVRLCFRHGRLRQRSAMTEAVRWMRRGLRILEPLDGREARAWRARLVAELAWIRQRQRRYREAERLCREALAEGEAIDELRAQARASYTLDWALFEMGRTDEATYSRRALEIYRLLGDPDHEGIVLNNLGGFAYWGGRWSEAIDLYRQAGVCRQRAGNDADTAQSYANIGEILSDQGRLEEAERHLLRAERVWTSTGHREGAAFASMLLGRLSVRAGRGAEGVALLEATAADMRKVGVGYYADLANALVAEGESMGGSPERGLEVASELLGSGCAYVALLRRASGIALWRMDQPEAAQNELEQALSEARNRGEDYEVALVLDALSVLGATDAGQDAERDAIAEQLGIERLPSLTDLRQGTAAGSPRWVAYPTTGDPTTGDPTGNDVAAGAAEAREPLSRR